jgi:hypothetical protein
VKRVAIILSLFLLVSCHSVPNNAPAPATTALQNNAVVQAQFDTIVQNANILLKSVGDNLKPYVQAILNASATGKAASGKVAVGVQDQANENNDLKSQVTNATASNWIRNIFGGLSVVGLLGAIVCGIFLLRTGDSTLEYGVLGGGALFVPGLAVYVVLPELQMLAHLGALIVFWVVIALVLGFVGYLVYLAVSRKLTLKTAQSTLATTQSTLKTVSTDLVTSVKTALDSVPVPAKPAVLAALSAQQAPITQATVDQVQAANPALATPVVAS